MMSRACGLTFAVAFGVASGLGSGSTVRADEPGPATRPSKAAAKTDSRKADSRAPDLRKPELAEVGLVREQAISAIERLAASKSAEVRANAVEAAGSIPVRFKEIITKAVGDSNLGVRTVAAMTIGRRRIKDLAPEVTPLLKDQSPFARSAAIFALARNGEPVDQTPLAPMLLKDPSPKVRAHAAYVIGEIGNKTAVGLLRQATREKCPLASEVDNHALSLQASEALVKLGENSQVDSIRAALYGSAEELETAALAAQILGQLGDRGSISHLSNLSVYRDKAGNTLPPEVRLSIAASLCRLGETGISALALDFVSNENPLLRKEAANVLGSSGKQEFLPTLGDLLKDPDEAVQIAAADAILRIVEKTK